jgi:hypothetical protein
MHGRFSRRLLLVLLALIALAIVPATFCMDDGEIVDGSDSYVRGGFYCDEFAPSGVKLDRTLSTEQDGAQARIADRFSSTDGKAHDVRIGYVTEFDDSDVGLGVNGGPIRQYEEYETVDFTQSPSTVLVHADMDSIDGSDDTMGGAITYLQAPDRAVFADYDDYTAFYHRTVPASGSLNITQVLSHAYTLAEAARIATGTADAADLPKVAITDPASGSMVSTPTVVVKGTATPDPAVR